MILQASLFKCCCSQIRTHVRADDADDDPPNGWVMIQTDATFDQNKSNDFPPIAVQRP